MFLDTVNSEIIVTDRKVVKQPATAPAAPYEAWKYMPHSQILHHGTACCEAAREWLLAMDCSQLTGESPLSGPRWIRTLYEWGPSGHPIHWCETVKRKTLDCGVLAALALECFKERDVCALPAQFVQRYSKDATTHWEGRWKTDEVSAHWIHDDVIYHEGCAVLLPDGTIQLWDASAGWWVNPSQTAGYGSLAALKIWAGAGMVRSSFQWGTHHIRANEWIAL